MSTIPIDTIAAFIPASSLATTNASESGFLPVMRQWAPILFYVLGAFLCARAMYMVNVGRMRSRTHKPERRMRDRERSYRATMWFWGILTSAFGMLGIARQFEVLSWLETMARNLFRDTESGTLTRTIAAVVVGVLGVGGLFFLGVFLRRARELMPRLVLAFAGLFILGVYMVLRITPIDAVAAVMDYDILFLKVRWLIELAGIFLIVLCTIMNGWWYHPQPPECPDSSECPASKDQRSPFIRSIFAR